MSGLYSVIDLAQIGLAFERLSVKVSAENIASANVAGYTAKQIDRASFVESLGSEILRGRDYNEASFTSRWVVENSQKEIRLDEEVFSLSTSELRYQALAQMVKAKFSLIDLAMGVKGR